MSFEISSLAQQTHEHGQRLTQGLTITNNTNEVKYNN